ncbi:MAG: family 43 glycosylhydrolase, partial [Mycobacterium leprae]
MRRLRTALGLLLIVLVLAGCAAPPKAISSRAGTFSNPVYVGGKDNLPEAPDPTAIKYNGDYYAYVTGDPCLVLTSPDLVNWKLIGPMLQDRVNCWAPSVTYKNGTFYAYAATLQPGGGEPGRRVRLYTSQSPAGPFVLQGDVTDVYSYDPGYFMDTDGKEYLYWTETCDRLPIDCSGNANVVDQLVTMQKLSGHLTQVTEAEGWECKDRCIMEAPSVTRHNGLYYLLYSGSAYENENYANGWARSKVPMGPGGVA